MKPSNSDIPQEFFKFLQTIEFPTYHQLSLDEIRIFCKGLYPTVWRNLIQCAQSKDIVKERRLQVFVNDIRHCERRRLLKKESELEVKELKLWTKEVETKELLLKLEEVNKEKSNLIEGKLNLVSRALTKKKLSETDVTNLQRREWMLQNVLSELKANKKETYDTLTNFQNIFKLNNDGDLENKLHKCLIQIKKKQSHGNTTLLSGEAEAEMLLPLVKYPSETLFDILVKNSNDRLEELKATREPYDLGPTQTIYTNTISLHCELGLQTMKNRQYIKQIQEKMKANIEVLEDYLDSYGCELLVLKCEKIATAERVNILGKILGDLVSKQGLFQNDDIVKYCGTATATLNKILSKDIEKARDEIMRYLTIQNVTAHKIKCLKEYMTSVFNALHRGGVIENKYKGIQFRFPKISFTELRQFYSEPHKTKINTSFDLDISDITNDDEKTFVDELKLYLNKFNLEKNKRILLKTGERLWISETIESKVSILQRQSLENKMPPLFNPAFSIETNLQNIMKPIQRIKEQEQIIEKINAIQIYKGDIDIQNIEAEEETTIDNIKKQISENMATLDKCVRKLDDFHQDFEFWSQGQAKKYISDSRTFRGKTYPEIERYFMKTMRS